MDLPGVAEDMPSVEKGGGEREKPSAARIGILARLFVLVVLSIIPALSVQIFNEIELRKARELEVGDNALRLAKFASGELDRIIDNARGLLVSLSHLGGVRSQDAAECSSYVSALNKSFPQYRVIGAIDITGRPFCASAPIPAQATAADRPYFNKAIETGQFTIGEYIIGRIVRKPILPLALPFSGADEKIAGVVYASLDLEWLANYFKDSKPLGKQATLAITDRQATVLVRIPDNELYAGTKFSQIYHKYVFARESGTDEIIGIDGVLRILGYVPINQTPLGLYVGVGITKEVAFAAVNRASITGFILIVAGLLLGLVVAWFGGRYFVSRPVAKLMGAAAQWSRGNFGARAALGAGSSELTELGRTFDSMAALLLRQQQENAALLSSLEDRVEERTRKLEGAQVELKARAGELEAANHELRSEMRRREQAEEVLRHVQKIDALGQLTGGIAHDFNNILHVILGNLGAVERRLNLGASDESSLRRLVQVATRAAEQAAALTRQLLAFARRQPLAPKPLDVNKLITGISDMLHSTLGEAIDLEIVLGARLWQTLADAIELENAILNLAVNSRDAMPSGGKLTIETTNAYLDENYAATEENVRPGQYLAIAITDTGTGMSPEVIAKAFDPFFTTKEAEQGTGLGLSQVYGFIKQSGGHAKIYSEPGNGTTIKLYLPRLLGSAEAAEERLSAEAAPARGNAEVVLVVEDQTDVRNLAIDTLSELGYEVIDAADGQAALRAIASRPDISLLFTDVGLPGGLNGRQLAEEARLRRSDLKVLYTTGYARNAIVHQGRLDPGVELIVKPFTHAELAAKIRDILNR